MPLERVVEFKIAVNIDLLPDLIFFVGKTGSAMFEDRPEKLPRPRDPRLFQLARRLDEILNQLTLYIQPQVVKLPYDSLDSLVREVLERLESVYKEVIYYIQLIDRLKAQLTVARELAVVKPTAMPSVEALVTYVVLPGRAVKEVVELAKSFNATVVPQKNVYIIAVERKQAELLKTALEKLGARVFTFQELAEIEPVEALEEKLKKAESELKAVVSRHVGDLNIAYTLKSAIASIIEIYAKSAIDEGLEMGHLFNSYEREIKKLERQITDLEKIKTVLTSLGERGAFNLPEGFKIYIDPKTPIEAPHIVQELNGIKVALVRGEAQGLELSREYLADVKSSINTINDSIRSTTQTLQRLKKELETVEKVYTEFSVYSDKKWEEHKDMASVTFYVLERDVNKIDEVLAEFVKRNSVKLDMVKKLRYRYFNEVPYERRPTLEKYPTPIRQFTKIVYMYGVPKANEISPVPLVALIFPVFFGWMFGDLGHGFLLFLLGVFLMTKLFGGRYRDWGIFWATTGAASMIFGGLVYQEVFGFGFKELGIKLPFAPLFHPFGKEQLVVLDGVIESMRAAFILGFLLILLAFATKFVNIWRKGEPDVALGLVLPQILLFFSIGMVLFGIVRDSLKMHFLDPLLQLPWALVAIGSIVWSVVGLLILRARYRGHEESPPLIEEFIFGFVESPLGAMANIPSFARLVILILIHGVFSKMVNAAALAAGPFGIVIAVLGHAMIALVEGFFSFIQSLRLTFYEVLSKFYEGKGRLFTPLRIP
ncbi:MAG: V-type ATPase 116kDa subunit family protein [Pyrobaculum sp.]